jgi:chemotaxis signal transduction protein
VTNISGRGVGMDVVRRNIQSLRGSVEVATVDGEGSTFTIRLPLTLAIIDGFLTGVGKASYVVPLDSVVECIELADVPANRNYLNLRGEVLPFVRLRELFGIHGAAPSRQNVVIVQYAGEKAGLVVDALLGEFQTVIKPLGVLFKNIRGIGGSTILGTGDVALILDVPALVSRAGAVESRSADARLRRRPSADRKVLSCPPFAPAAAPQAPGLGRDRPSSAQLATASLRLPKRTFALLLPAHSKKVSHAFQPQDRYPPQHRLRPHPLPADFVALIGISRVGDLQREISDLVKDKNVKVKLANDVIDNVQGVGRFHRNMLIGKSDEATRVEMAKVVEARATVSKAFDALDKFSYGDQGKAAIDAAKEARKIFVAASIKLEEQAKGRQWDEAVKHFNKRLPAGLQRLHEDRGSDFINYQTDLAEKSGMEAEALAASSRTLILGLAAAAVLIGLLLAYLITRSITGPTGKLVAATTKMADGDFRLQARHRQQG